MYLQKLQLFNYKNHKVYGVQFCNGINCITGNNGTGKTNLADAIWFLANAKSYFTNMDKHIISIGENEFSVHGWFSGEKDTDIIITFSDFGKKTIKKNGKTLQRIMDHIGFVSAVFITPYDIELVHGNSDERRRFLDITICQTDVNYLNNLHTYKKTLEQRNAFLKKFEGQHFDIHLLDAYDYKLAECGDFIYNKRKQFFAEFLPYFNESFSFLFENKSIPEINFISNLHENTMQVILQKNQRVDMAALRTTEGIHKDDWLCKIGDMELKKFASQGQIKGFTIALKLAQYEYFLSKTNQKPILLLDDIFEKIDEQKAIQLMHLLDTEKFGQIFITDTHANRVEEHIKMLDKEHVFIEL